MSTVSVDDVMNVVSVGSLPVNKPAVILSADTTKSSCSNALNDII